MRTENIDSSSTNSDNTTTNVTSTPSEPPPPYQDPDQNVVSHIYNEQQEAEQAGETAAFLTALSGRRDRPNQQRQPTGSRSSSDIDSLLESDSEWSENEQQLHHAPTHLTQSSDTQNRVIEQFEIYEPPADSRPSVPSFTTRASMASQRLAQSVSNKIISPVSRILDPVAQLINRISRKFDFLIAKVGNPLILKRLLYLFFVFLIIYVSFESGLLPGSSRDGFGGDYYDRDSLVEFLRNSVRPDIIQERLEYLSSMPHQAGTAGDLTLAKYIEEQFKLYGLSPVELSEYVRF